jgi:hypothetical protein
MSEMHNTNNTDILNKYIAAPAINWDEYPSIEKQQDYVLQGVVVALFVTLMLISIFVIK